MKSEIPSQRAEAEIAAGAAAASNAIKEFADGLEEGDDDESSGWRSGCYWADSGTAAYICHGSASAVRLWPIVMAAQRPIADIGINSMLDSVVVVHIGMAGRRAIRRCP